MIEKKQAVPQGLKPVLLVVEGFKDIEFLRRMSRILHAHDPSLPKLGKLEEQGRIVYIPFGGGGIDAWTYRLAPLGLREVHLYNRELPPESEYRRRAAEAVDERERCLAFRTSKRGLENYLHPDAVLASEGIDVAFGDFDPVVELTAKRLQERDAPERPWGLLPRRTQAERMHRAKQRLNTSVVEAMSFDMLKDRDPDGEVVSWLRTIGELLTQG